MHMSGSTSEQELNEHFDLISIPNVELSILGDLAQVDVLVINASNSDHHLWRVDNIYVHDNLLTPSQCSPVYRSWV